MLLTQNSKMKKSSDQQYIIYNFGIPAFKSMTGLRTCPNAGLCSKGCYAKQGTYRFSNVINAYEERLKCSRSENFIEMISLELNKLLDVHHDKQLIIRINDSGDFYNLDYLNKWIDISEKYSNVLFYAYTKQVSLIKTYAQDSLIKFIFSFGGMEDKLIDVKNDYHAKVFETSEEMKQSKYIDGSHDDKVAALSEFKKIGLVYHGNKGYNKTLWRKIS